MGIKKLAKKIYMKLYEISSYSHSQEYSRVKSGLHVCVILNNVNLENWRRSSLLTIRHLLTTRSTSSLSIMRNMAREA